jgi:16S rRNA (guanine527-N7)-methyltransferase
VKRNPESLYGLSLSDFQKALFDTFLSEMLEWNQKFNLTAIREVDAIEIKHFLDSLSVVEAFKDGFVPGSMIDIGTGAGLPGIPLRVVYPEAKLTLVESIKKKAGFCEHAAQALGLENVIVSTARAEEIGQDPLHREKYDLVLARAVAIMPVLVEYLLPLAMIGGRVVMQKGKNAREESENSRNAIRLLGGKLLDIIPIDLPEVEDERYLVVLEKVRTTPSEFPRRVGVPAKSPIQN